MELRFKPHSWQESWASYSLPTYSPRSLLSLPQESGNQTFQLCPLPLWVLQRGFPRENRVPVRNGREGYNAGQTEVALFTAQVLRAALIEGPPVMSVNQSPSTACHKEILLLRATMWFTGSFLQDEGSICKFVSISDSEASVFLPSQNSPSSLLLYVWRSQEIHLSSWERKGC